MEEIEQKMMISDSFIYSKLIINDIDMFLDIKREFEEGFNDYKETGDSTLINSLNCNNDGDNFIVVATSWKNFILN